MTPIAKTTLVLTLVLGVWLPAAAGGGNGALVGESGASAAKGLQATPAKPNGNGIVVRYSIENVPEAGKAVQVELAFSGVADGATATAWFTLDAGLAWAAAAPAELTLRGKAPVRLQLAVVPLSEGIAYLNVFTRQAGADSATAVPVRVGKATPHLRQPGALKAMPDGDKVISVPVP